MPLSILQAEKFAQKPFGTYIEFNQLLFWVFSLIGLI